MCARWCIWLTGRCQVGQNDSSWACSALVWCGRLDRTVLTHVHQLLACQPGAASWLKARPRQKAQSQKAPHRSTLVGLKLEMVHIADGDRSHVATVDLCNMVSSACSGPLKFLNGSLGQTGGQRKRPSLPEPLGRSWSACGRLANSSFACQPAV